jgi:hypothetical protein
MPIPQAEFIFAVLGEGRVKSKKKKAKGKKQETERNSFFA